MVLVWSGLTIATVPSTVAERRARGVKTGGTNKYEGHAQSYKCIGLIRCTINNIL